MKKIVVILMALAMFSMLSMSSVEGQRDKVEVWVSLDKTPYEPGDQGEIHVTIRNTGEDPIEIRNMTIQFTSWMFYTEDGWDSLGNQTIVLDPVVIVSSDAAVALDEIAFTVPSDARGISTLVDLSIYTNQGEVPEWAIRGWNSRIEVISAYDLRSLRAMDNIVTLLTVVAVLAIVSAIIIASAVFLSGRRPGVT